MNENDRKLLSVSVSDADWHRFFDFCKRQALMGVGFIGTYLYKIVCLITNYH